MHSQQRHLGRMKSGRPHWNEKPEKEADCKSVLQRTQPQSCCTNKKDKKVFAKLKVFIMTPILAV